MSAYNQKIKEFYEYFNDSNAIFFIDNNIDRVKETIELAFGVQTPEYPILNNKGYFEKIHQFINCDNNK